MSLSDIDEDVSLTSAENSTILKASLLFPQGEEEDNVGTDVMLNRMEEMFLLHWV